MNKHGYDSIDEVMQRGVQPLSPGAFEAAANETGALLLDTRAPQVFAQGFIPNAINIGIDGRVYRSYVNSLPTETLISGGSPMRWFARF